MDKPRHPLVIRPWKIKPSQKTRFHPPPIPDRQRSRADKPGVTKNG